MNESTVKVLSIGILVVALVGSAFYIGTLTERIRLIENGQGNTVGAQVGANNPGQPQQPQEREVGEVVGLRETDKVRGNRDARILLIEYSDMSCPYCKRFHPTAQQIVDEFDGQVAWIHRHFPLEAIHPRARAEAEAAECVNELGGEEAFWSFIDKVYAGQTGVGTLDAQLAAYANESGVDGNAVLECLNSGKYSDFVSEDLESGIAAGVSGTPGNILLDTQTGEKVLLPGALPYAQFEQVIESLLQN